MRHEVRPLTYSVRCVTGCVNLLPRQRVLRRMRPERCVCGQLALRRTRRNQQYRLLLHYCAKRDASSVKPSPINRRLISHRGPNLIRFGYSGPDASPIRKYPQVSCTSTRGEYREKHDGQGTSDRRDMLPLVMGQRGRGGGSTQAMTQSDCNGRVQTCAVDLDSTHILNCTTLTLREVLTFFSDHRFLFLFCEQKVATFCTFGNLVLCSESYLPPTKCSTQGIVNKSRQDKTNLTSSRFFPLQSNFFPPGLLFVFVAHTNAQEFVDQHHRTVKMSTRKQTELENCKQCRQQLCVCSLSGVILPPFSSPEQLSLSRLWKWVRLQDSFKNQEPNSYVQPTKQQKSSNTPSQGNARIFRRTNKTQNPEIVDPHSSGPFSFIV